MNILYRLPKRQTNIILVFLCLLIIVFGVFVGLFVATQYVAYRLDYTDDLGKPLIGRIYNPINFCFWLVHFGNNDSLENIFRSATWLFVVIVLLVTIGVLILNFIVRTKHKETDVCGSAHWATYKEVKKSGLLSGEGIYAGAWYNRMENTLEYLRFSGEGNVLVCAPTGAGKTTGVIIPSVLSWKDSVLVNDVKGEIFELTSGYRKKVLNNIVIKFDPTDQTQNGGCFNPLWEIRKGFVEVKDTQNLVEILTDPDGKEERNHWTQRAGDLLVGVILHVLYTQKDKSLAGVLDFLSGQGKTDQEALNEMLNTEHDQELIQGWREKITNSPTKTHPVVKSVAQEMLNLEPEERSGVISTARRFLNLFKDPILAQNTSRSDFRIYDLMNHEQAMSLYIVIPESDRDRLRPLIRIILKLISSRLLEKVNFSEGRSVPNYKHPLLLVLDEFDSLGKLSFIQHDLAVIRAYGIKAIIIVQDKGQIYKSYGRDESISSNCQVKVMYATNKLETAQEIANMAGVSTVVKFSKTSSGRMSHVVPGSLSEGVQEVQRPLITADEVMRLSQEDVIIFIGNLPPILGRKIRYYLDPVFSERAKTPPIDQSDRILLDVSQLGYPVQASSSKKESVKSGEIEITEFTLMQEDDRDKGDNLII